jgi:NAD(P)-dependent dehydrogenase (short-subunit alcohol dehydrogenase family)
MENTILIIGGTDGIGKAVALQMAQKGYSVTAVGRSEQKGKNVLNKLRSLHPSGQHLFVQADVSQLHNVAALANRLKALSKGYQIILHTADVLKLKREETAEGLEVSIAINFYSRFLLNHLLIEAWDAPKPHRVIHVAAAGFPTGKDFKKKFPVAADASSFTGHGIGQVANDFYGFYKSREWEKQNIRINILNPGIVDTDIRRNGTFPKWLMKLEPIMGFLMQSITKTADEYAKVVVEIASGQSIYADSSVMINPSGKPKKPSRQLLDIQMQQYVVETTQKQIEGILSHIPIAFGPVSGK